MSNGDTNALSRMARRVTTGMLGSGLLGGAANKAIDREYRMHVVESESTGETPMTRAEFIRKRGRG